MTPTIVDVDLLDDGEAADIYARLEALRPRWLSRGEGFATLGVATYLDVMASERPEETYYARLPEQNGLIRTHFGDLLEKVAAALSALLGAPTRYEEAVALPGFHVFESAGVSTQSWPNQHFDLQHRSLRWPFPLASEDDLVSFTLAIALPRYGGALEFWNVVEADVARLQRLGRTVTMELLGNTKPVRRHEYRVGRMSVQLAPIMHRIAAVPVRYPGDQRITLQGHGVRDSGGWVLYW
ncbi:hypothetical protein StrepF001_42190 [Streptomyces sp. F001]|nr:hypothetical protein StrepF001_42190 [Streptomyces sp. F001]